ncbi:hypothetical protein [Tenacibaculum sp. nBUS_03]|uniref:hypothetical protein n=1 Tax=Tenacibaculum sp. nBUS_03 TaxID=3395320 RepID=UPI003EBC539E
MDDINWDDLANKASSITEVDLQKDLNDLTNFSTKDLDLIIKESAISTQNAYSIMEELKDATRSNNEKIQAISKINNGVNFLMKLVSKITQ